MTKSWIRRLALALTLCLIVNNCIRYDSLHALAAEKTVSSGDAVQTLPLATDDETIAEDTAPDDTQAKSVVIEEEDTIVDSIQSDVSDGDAVNSIVVSSGTYGLLSASTDQYINSYEDFLLLQSQCDTYAGWAGYTWHITSIAEGTWDLTEELKDFAGIGTAKNPFQGKLVCDYAIGIQLKMNTPLFAHLGDGAVIEKLNAVAEGSSAVLAENLSGKVTVSDCTLGGSLKSPDEAGVIAAKVADGSSITLNNVIVNEITVEGAIAGGIAGSAGDNVTVTMDDSTSLKVAVVGTRAAGGHFGKVAGSASWNLADEDKITANMVANSGDCYAGQYAGILEGTSGGTVGKLTIMGSQVAVNVSGTGNGGGLLGLIGSNAQVVLAEQLTIAGNISTNGYAGGVAAEINGGADGMVLSGITLSANVSGNVAGGAVGRAVRGSCQIGNITVSSAVSAMDAAGGVVGSIEGGQYIIGVDGGNIIIGSGLVTGSQKSGGVIGAVSSQAAVEVQGTINVGKVNSGWNGGLLVGTQSSSLIYFGNPDGSDDQLVVDSSDEVTYDELVRYGGIFRNQSINNGRLIGDGTLAKVGVINSTINKSGSDYVLTSAVDFETLAIALNTNGGFGTEAFSGLTAGDCKTLLAASYLVQPVDGNTIDISYEKTGIVTLDRNDKESEEYAFSGTMKGAYKGVTLHQDSAIRQQKLGIFACVAGATFEKLTITGTIEKGTYVGGLAYYVMGSGATLTDVTMQKTFATSTNGIVGGVFGADYNTTGEVTITATNLTLASIFDNPSSRIAGFIVELDNATVNMTDTVIGGSMLTTTGDTTHTSDAITGGFLGMLWENVKGTVDGLTVQSGTTYTAAANFGALVTVATSQKGGRLTMRDVKLKNLTVTPSATDNSQFRSSLMVWDAKKLILEVIDYDASGCTVNTTDGNFDEIAGTTKAGSGAYTNSGIVSIHKTGTNYPAYHYENQATYTKTEPDGNNYTMYFYDVFQWLDDANGNPQKWMTDNVVDSVEDVLLWDILHYATEGNVFQTFNEYYKAIPYEKYSSVIMWDTLTLSGNLDLRKISFYPIPRIGCSLNAQTGTVITFDAAPMETWKLHNLGDNAGDRTQHYGLQGGLLYEPQEVYINGDGGELTLKGNIANFKKYSGALILGNSGVSVACVIKNITLDGLAINNYTGQEAGLLVSKVRGNSTAASYGNVIATFDNIKMTGYDSYQKNGKKVAAALIGFVGGNSVMDIRLNFKNMVIADNADGKSNHNGDVLKYASFIYEYDYTDDAQINEGYGLYLFSQSDAESGNVTYGQELDTETEFSDNANLVYKVMFNGVDNTDTDYKPYVYRYENIEVNPKSGNILKGCGTYDDPYIIETEKQLLTLYRFINETGTAPNNYQYKTFYNGWKIIAPGDDSKFCTTKHRVTLNADGSLPASGAEDVRTFSETSNNFPTPDELSRAYYQLASDIDLSAKMTTTYETIADVFVGFGTKERPFVGVWDGNGHTITLPDKPKKITNTSAKDYKYEAYENYGFIQYAKGAVIKDMTIQSAVDGSGNFETSNAVRVKTSGGGVISCILGGDNIIDNVTVKAGFNVADIVEDRLVYNSKTKEDEIKSGVTVEDMAVGGYVGLVQKGGLIIRNMPADALTRFYMDVDSAETPANYDLLGSVVGKVEDGYVLYEGGGNTGSLTWTGTGGNTTYQQVPNYTILNGDGLKEACKELKITGSKADTATPITINIPTAGALQVMSMALNSDALNIRPSDCPYYTENTEDEAGYTELSRSRKASYNDIGCTSATADYISAAKYDNVMNYTQDGYKNADNAYAYPYLYQYMNITGDSYLDYLADYRVKISGTYYDRKYSILNPTVTGKNATIYQVWWKLAENSTYNMTEAVLGKAFRGIGAIYQVGPIEDKNEIYGASFHGNFEGNGSTVKIEFNRKLLGDDKSDGSSTSKTTDRLVSAGLFNVLHGKEAALYPQEEDFCDINGTANTMNCMVIQNLTITGTITADPNANIANKKYHLGAVAGLTNGKLNLVLDNVRVQDFYEYGVKQTEEGGYNVGGLIGYMGNRAYVLMRDCSVVNATIKGEQEGGGLVGKSDAYGLKVVGTTVDAVTVYAGSNAGGMLGWASKDNNGDRKIMLLGTSEKPNIVKNSKIGNADGSYITDRAGGLIGALERTFSVQYGEVEDVELSAYKNIGGIVGHASMNAEKMFDFMSTISDVSVTDMVAKEANLCDAETNGMGGIVGCNYQNLTIENAMVSGSAADSFKMVPKLRRTGIGGSGGIVGANAMHQSVKWMHTLTMTNCSVDTVSVVMDVDNYNNVSVAAGGLVGYVGAPVILSGSQSVINSAITAPLASEATQSIMAAGGGFGYVDGSRWASTDYKFIAAAADGTAYKGLTLSNNTVTAKQAGGVGGYVTDKNTGIRLAGLSVSGGRVTSDESAGGVYGYIIADNHGTVLDSGSVANTITGVTVSGREAGGVIGTLKMHENMRLQSVVLNNNEIIASQETIGAPYSAAGVIGCYIAEDAANTTDPLRLYDIKLYGNTIAAETTGDTLTEAEAANIAVGGLIGRVQDDIDGTMTEDILYDNPVIDSTNKIGVRKTDTEEVKLVKLDATGDAPAYTLSALNDTEVAAVASAVTPENGTPVMDYEVLEELEETYGCFVGNMVGVINSQRVQLYILRSADTGNKLVTPLLSSNPPVIDVGRTVAQSVDDYRQYCHIIYGAESSVAQVGIPETTGAATNLTDMANAVSVVNSAYGAGDGLGILQEYRLSKAAITTFENTYHETFTFAEGMTLNFPILVWKAEYGDLQMVMEHIVDVMTNVAGLSATDIEEEYLTVSAQQKLFDGTNVTDGVDEACIQVTTLDGETIYKYIDFDGASDGILTFTELTFTYGWQDHQKTFRLPVFVEEPILYNVHALVVEGRATNADSVIEKGIADSVENIIMANDSDYTLLLEYSYGEARKDMPDNSYVDKVFYVSNVTKDKYITKGTRLMLIDVSEGSVNKNKVYYYEVEQNGLTSLAFSQFKDSKGDYYQNISINSIPDAGTVGEDGTASYTDLAGHVLKDTGVEMFLLTVLAPDNAGETNEYYDIHAGIQIEDESLRSRFYPMEGKTEADAEADYTVLSIPGLSITFRNKGTDTNIEGSINKESTLQVDAVVDIKAKDQLYWEEKKKATEDTPLIDSSNNGKFLELAFYLRDDNNNRVRFPSGTNFSYEMTDESSNAVYSESKVIPDDSVIYYYKDIRNAFGIKDFAYQINDLQKDTFVDMHFELDFSGADLSNITEESYVAWLELLRTANKDYPMGNGNRLDRHSEEIKANAAHQFGFAIRAKELNQLAINTYPTANEQDIIDYTVMFDFSQILKQSSGIGIDVLVEKWANYDYTVTYELYRKVPDAEDVAVYERYQGDLIGLTADDGEVGTVTGARVSSQGAMTTQYNFTARELKAREGYVFFPCQIVLQTDDLTEDLTALTNYKLIATLTITEKETNEQISVAQPAEQTTDFFVYTITKLKFDL